MIDEIKITSLTGRGSIVMKTRMYWSYWLDDVDWGQVEGVHHTYQFYSQVGESIVSTSVRSRPISITGWVVDGYAGTLQERCDFLNTFISPVEDYELEYRDKKIRFRPDYSIQYSRETTKNNRLVRMFLISGTCPFPLFSDAEDTAVQFDKKKKMFRFPTDFGQSAPLVFAEVGRAFSADVYNKGGFSTGAVIRMRFTGEVQSPRVKSLTTGEFIGVNRTFSRGEQLEISTTPGSKRITLLAEDGTRKDLISKRDFQSTFFQLRPGVNRIALDFDDLSQRPNVDVTLYFTPLYQEVE